VEELIDVSIMNGFENITKLGGYIILCSVGGTMLELIPEGFRLLKIFLGATLEVSSGIHMLSLLSISAQGKTLCILSATAFGGLCALLQINSMLKETDLNLLPCLLGKSLQTGITALMLLIL
jgi:hypothetical protein